MNFANFTEHLQPTASGLCYPQMLHRIWYKNITKISKYSVGLTVGNMVGFLSLLISFDTSFLIKNTYLMIIQKLLTTN